MSYMFVIAEDSQDQAYETIGAAIEGKSKSRFLVRMKSRDAHIIDAQWSIWWSDVERCLYCLVQNVTAQKSIDRFWQGMLQMLSRDFRTPLASIANVLQMLQDGQLGDLSDRSGEMIQLAQRSVKDLLDMINDLLEVEKMKAGMLPLDVQMMELSQIFEASLKAVSGFAQERKVLIEYVPTTAI